MSLSRTVWAWGLWACLAYVGLSPRVAFASQGETTAHVEPGAGCRASVVVIGAVTNPAPFPKELLSWKRQLTNPPFSFFKGFSLLKALSSSLAANRKPFKAQLAGPYFMELKLLGRRLSAKGREQYRFQLKLIERKGKRSKVISNGTMRLDRGGTFFVAGPKVGRKTLILAITLK